MFNGRIVKAEILWTRKCNLRCQYCGMYRDNGLVKKDWDLWKIGMNNLKSLSGDNFFTAVYGAEPLQDFEYLPEYFSYANKLGFYHTLITNCVDKDVKKKLFILVENGLNSLTVSFDGSENELGDKSSDLKSETGLDIIYWFGKEFKNIRDRAVVFTLTKTNLFNILEWIPKLSKDNIYIFFDLIHNDIGNPGTKCKNYEGIDSLLFTMADKDLLIEFGIKLKEMKDMGEYRIHQSNSFIDVLINHPELYINKKWNCAKDYGFPAWLTIDYDGLVRICDDFYIEGEKKWYFWDLIPEIFDHEFTEYWKDKTIDYCKGCFWNTHFDAHRIKQGVELFVDYINNSI